MGVLVNLIPCDKKKSHSNFSTHRPKIMILSSRRNFGSRIVYVQFFRIIFFFNFVKRKPSIIRKISIIYYLGKSRSIPKIGKKNDVEGKNNFDFT